MVLRFEVNQAEAFRQGVNVEKSTNHLDVDPSALPQEERNLIADRLNGIDVCKLHVEFDGTVGKVLPDRHLAMERSRICANLPSFEGLMKAIRENQAEVDAELKQRSK